MGQVVLITGCRSGFGLHMAVHAARAGHTVYAGLRDAGDAGELLRAAGDLDVRPLQLDVTDARQREDAVARVVAETGRLDALVNNAGTALGGPLEMIDEDELRALFDLNVFAPWALTKAALPTMRAQGRGRVINISSMSGRQALPVLGAYASSKFALEGMSEAWRRELADLGVDVILVEPGAYRTDIFGRNRRVARRAHDEPAYAELLRRFEAIYDRSVERMARDPEEVAALVVRLLAAKRPVLRHPIGPATLVRNLALRLLPQRAVEGLVAAALKRGSR
ncbi:MAG: SDR family oxidoreductase [Myxococcales bacterium]|nr:SDR family oxidoreductase [Myxococcales bacterium]MCB9733619.1 SDR family oxidoreductase [Deltaproteobacteria bacterium]